MQQQLGLAPAVFQAPPIMFPGQVSAAMARGGPGAAFSAMTQASSSGGMSAPPPVQGGSFMTQGSVGTSFGAGVFPGQQLQTYTNQSPMFQGPTGIMMPMSPGANFNPYASSNPYAGLAARGPYQGPPSLFTPMTPAPPPAYAGQLGQMPFGPPPPSSQFDTPYQAGLEREHLADDTLYGRAVSGMGVGARVATDFTGGLAGAALGARMGGTFGRTGRMAGGIVGGLAGLAGMEFSGGGQAGQNAFMNMVGAPLIQQRGQAGAFEEISRGFISSGPELHASGIGLSHHASDQAASGIRSIAASANFQKETGNRFNVQDLMKISDESSRSGMMTGVQSASQMTARVKDIAKSLSSFMELAQEPDIQRALQTMGQLRASGLSLAETTQAVTQGRAFARMAGQSFAELSAQGGAMGSQTFQAMGLSQGTGLRAGMMNSALARGSENSGILSTQQMSLAGGAQGLANMNNMYSAAALQTPMLAPSVMSASGGINAGALQNLIGGNVSPTNQVNNATSALQSITNRQGVGGLGAAIAMQPLIQDTLARTLQAQSPFGQRNFEDRNIMSRMREMNLSGSAGFITAAKSMGMTDAQATARATELADPRHFQKQRAQIETQRQESRTTELARNEDQRPGTLDTVTRLTDNVVGRALTPGGASIGDVRRGMRGLGQLGRDLSHAGESLAHISPVYAPESVALQRDLSRTARSSEMGNVMRELDTESHRRRPGFFEKYSQRGDLSEAFGMSRTGMMIADAATVGGVDALQNLADPFGTRRNERSREFRDVGRFADDALHSTRAQEVAANRNIGRTFGAGRAGLERKSAFTLDALNTLSRGGGLGEGGSMLANLGMRTTAMVATDGFADPGNIATRGMARQRDLEAAYVRSMSGTGRSEEDLRASFRQNQSTIGAQTSSAMMALATDDQRAQLRDTAQAGGAMTQTGSTGFVQAAQARQARGVDRVFGHQEHAAQRDAANKIFDRVAATGGEYGRNAEERRTSREAMATMAMYQAVIRDPLTPARDREAAQRQMARVQSEVAAKLGPERATDMNRRLEAGNGAIEREIRDDPARAAAARSFVANNASRTSGAAILQNVNAGRREQEQGTAAVQIAGGAGALSQRGGAIGDLFKDLGSGQFSESRFEDTIAGASSDRIAAISREGPRGRELAAALRQAQSTNRDVAARGQASVREITRKEGERDTTLRQDDRERFHGVTGAVRGLGRMVGIGDTEEEFVRKGLRQGTSSDREANAASDESASTEAAARERGIGGSGDAMLTAAQELRQAAEALNGYVANQGLDQAVAPQ